MLILDLGNLLHIVPNVDGMKFICNITQPQDVKNVLPSQMYMARVISILFLNVN